MISYTTRVQIVKPAITKDRYENDTYDYGDAATVIDVVRPLSIQPASTAIEGTNRFMVTEGWTLRTPVGMDLDLSPVDRVRWGGFEAAVNGAVSKWPHPIRPGGVHHVEANLTEATG